MWRGAVLAAAVGVAIAFIPLQASAHARLACADPAPGSVFPPGPRRVQAWFTQELAPEGSTMSVRDEKGRPVAGGQGGVDLDNLDRNSLLVRPRTLGPGTYVVRWKAVSALDGDVTQGMFRFTVLAPHALPRLPTLKIVSPSNCAGVSSSVALLFESSADLSTGTTARVGSQSTRLHVALDAQVIMPSRTQLVVAGAHRYRFTFRQVRAGTHTIRLFWGEPTRHTPMGPVHAVMVRVR